MGQEPPSRHPHIREEDRFRRLFEQSMDAVYIGSPDGAIIDVNQAWLDLFGYSRDELPSLNAIDFYANPDDRADFLRRMNETGFVRDEVLYKRKDGSTFLCQRSLVACRDDAGNIVEFQGINRDISSLRETEVSLRSSELRYRSLFEQSMDAICVTRHDGSIIDANPAWLELFGYSREELTSLNVIDTYASTDDRDIFLDHISDTGFIRDEQYFRRKDGSFIECDRSVTSLKDQNGRTVAYQALYRDITERRSAEKALRESELMLARSQEIGHIGSWLLNLDTNRLTWSDETYRIFGLEPQSFPATYEAFLNAIYPKDRTLVDRAYTDSLRHGSDGYEVEHRIIRSNTGEVRHVYEKCIHERNTQGDVVRSIGMVQDVTEHRIADKALRETEQKFRALFTDAPVSILIHDIDTGEIIDANPVACAAYGVASVEDLRDVDLWLDPPYSFDDALAWIRKTANEGPQQFEWLNRTVKGQLFWEQVQLTPVVINNTPRIMAVTVDFTERKKAADARLASEERYRTLFQNVMDAVCLVSSGGLLLEANQAYLSLFGYAETDVGSINVEHQYTDPNERTRMLEWLASHDVLLEDEVQLRTRDGTVMDCVRNVVARRDSAGTFIGAQSVIRDVTRQKRVLKELQESQERFVQLAEQSRTFTWEVDVNGLYTYVSPMVEQVIGYRPEDLVGSTHIYDLYPEDVREQLKSEALQIMHDKASLQDYENPIISKDAQIVWVSSTFVPLMGSNGTVTGYHGWDMDITERKQAEATITASEQRFRTLFEQSRDAIYIGTPDGTVIDVNKAWLDLFGYTREDLTSVNAADFYANPDDRAKFLRRITDTGVVGDEIRFRRKDGSEFDCARNVVARKGQHGDVIAVQGVLRDVTREKRDRAELERLARFDTLTDLLNRHSIVEKLSEWLRHSRRYHARLSILLLDIDHFKRVNDTYGHAAGDRVLEETASLLMSSTRQADFVGRYGGEEFLIILPRTDIDGAAVIAERIRTKIESAPLHIDDEATVPVTISLGVTQWHEDDSEDTLLARVDSALYRAKEGGRNRVEIAPAQSSGA